MEKLAKKIASLIRREAPELTYNQSKDLFRLVRRRLNLRPPNAPRAGTVRRLSKTEIDALLDAAHRQDPETALLIRTLYESAARVSELCSLEVRDLNTAELRLTIRRGKGNKRREVPITRELATALELFLIARGRREGRLFRSRSAPSFSPRRIQQIVKKLAEKAGIQNHVTPHVLRHTRLTLLAEAGMPKDHLQIFAGHTRPETTEIYTHTAALDVVKSFQEAQKNL